MTSLRRAISVVPSTGSIANLYAENVSNLPGDPLSFLDATRNVSVDSQGDLGQALGAAVRGFRQGLDRGLRVEAVLVSFDGASDALRDPGERRAADAGPHLRTEGFAVDGIGKRLADLPVGERFLGKIHSQSEGRGERIGDELLGQLRIRRHLRNLWCPYSRDVEIAGAIGLESNRGILDVDVLDTVEFRAALPVVFVGLERPSLVFVDSVTRNGPLPM